MDTLTASIFGFMNRGKELMVFDWDKAACLIKERKPKVASAGLEGDWEYTGDIIYVDGEPFMGSPYLASTWATPELDMDDEVIPCYRMESETPGWTESTVWPESALAILGAAQKDV